MTSAGIRRECTDCFELAEGRCAGCDGPLCEDCSCLCVFCGSELCGACDDRHDRDGCPAAPPEPLRFPEPPLIHPRAETAAYIALMVFLVLIAVVVGLYAVKLITEEVPS